MRPMGCFKRIAPVVDFPDAESRIRAFWEEQERRSDSPMPDLNDLPGRVPEAKP